MSKKNNTAVDSDDTETRTLDDQFARLSKTIVAPEGFEKRSDDLVGFWDYELTPIRCIPRAAKLMDNHVEKDKPSILLIVELTAPCGAVPGKKEDEEGEPFVAPEGSLVGIWYKPGMRKIRDLGGVEVFMKFDGEKDTGKPSPMKVFEVQSAKLGTRIPVTDDIRDKSRPIRGNDGKYVKLTDFDSRRPASEVTKEDASPLPF
jgi:hypothetical protein